MDEDVRGEDGFCGYDSPGEAPAAMLVAVEEIFLPLVETVESVEIWVIPTPRRMAILTPPFPILEIPRKTQVTLE